MLLKPSKVRLQVVKSLLVIISACLTKIQFPRLAVVKLQEVRHLLVNGSCVLHINTTIVPLETTLTTLIKTNNHYLLGFLFVPFK